MGKDDLSQGGSAPGPACGTRTRGLVRLRAGAGCLRRGTRRLALVAAAAAVLTAGCAKYNTYYLAKKAFDDAEHVRNEAIRKNEDPPKPVGLQKSNYDKAIQKAQKVLDEYPGHSLTDDALFLQAKAWHRLEGYRMSIRKLDLLFRNFPATDYLEEALYLQGLNYLLINSVDRSQEYLDRLERRFPKSRYRAETMKVSGDNAYALEQWQEAAAGYRRYLERNPGAKERDRIGLKLAQCLWELDDYAAAAVVLAGVVADTESPELGFRARLLQARVQVRLQDHGQAEALLASLRDEAEVYQARGDVRLVEAENLIAQDRPDEAASLLESMPEEWRTPTVRAQAADRLGSIYMARAEWEEARNSFQEALRKRADLEDPDLTRRLHDTLKDYMAADRALVDAKGAAAADLRLEKANALLFGFTRPAEAVGYYVAAAVDTAATPETAARALYGALVTYRDHLDQPDSAAYFAAELEARHPDSPQAYEARSGRTSDLLGYLLARRQQEQQERLAALTPQERLELQSLEGTDTLAGVRRPGAAAGLRRRMVYLSRRPNLVFPPTEDELARAAVRAATIRAASDKAAAADSVRAAAAAAAAAAKPTVPPPPPRPTGAEIGGAPRAGIPPAAPADTLRTGAVPDLQGAAADSAAALEGEPDQEQEEQEEDDEKDQEKKKEDTFDLRAPQPGPNPERTP